MRQTQLVLDAIKKELKRQRITYAMLAEQIDVSEATIKRSLARGPLTLERLEQIAEILRMPLLNLLRLADESPIAISQLSPEQERELVTDEKLLLVTFLALNEWTFEEIIASFEISEAEVVKRLTTLDRLGMIELLPGNRIKRLVSRNFSWRVHGPVQSFFEAEVKQDFLDNRFAGRLDHLRFLGARLSESSILKMHAAIDRLAEEFNQLAEADAHLPRGEKTAVGGVFATRPWELPTFRRLRNKPYLDSLKNAESDRD